MNTLKRPLAGLMDPDTEAGVESRYGRAWIEQLARIVRSEVGRLGLEVLGPLGGGRTACVLKVQRGSEPLVLKITPDVKRSGREAAALQRLADADVAPRLVEEWTSEQHGVEYHGLVLERLGEGGSLRGNPHRYPTSVEVAELLAVIRHCGESPLGVPVEPVTGHLLKGLDQGTGGGLHGSSAPSEDERAAARDTLSDLAARGWTSWTHGTLHPANLILTEDRGLFAIDPRPFLADPSYDAAEVAFKLGSEKEGRIHNLADGQRLLDDLAAHLDFDHDQALKWLGVIAASGV